MYSQIDRNKFLTFLLLILFVVIVAAGALIFSAAFFQDLLASLFVGFFAFIISLFSGLIGYYTGPAIVLKMTRAMDVTDDPNFLNLRTRLEILCTKAGIPMPRLHVIPDRALNAFATGRNPENSHVALTQGIIEHMNETELDAVIAHELAHIKNYDMRLMMIVSVLAGVLTTMSDFFLRSMFWTGGRGGNSNNKSGGGNVIILVVGIAFAVLAPIISALIQLAISRRREFLADMTSVEITRYPQSMIDALKKLDADTRPVQKATSGNAHMFIDYPLKDSGNFIRKLFSTHPPIQERIQAIQQI